MAKVLLEGVSKNQAEWHKHRATTLSASRVAAAMGMNKFQTPLALWAEMTGKVPPQEDNDIMAYGRHNEPFVAKLFEKKFKCPMTYPDTLFQHDTIEFATCTPDYLAVMENSQQVDVQIKTGRITSMPFWEENSVPTTAHLQVIWELGVLGLEVGFCAAMLGGDPDNFYTPEIEYSAELFEQMVELGAKFMDHVRKDVPPEASSEDWNLLNQLMKPQESVIATLPDEFEAVCREWIMLDASRKQLGADIKALKAQQEDIETRVKQVMGDAGVGVVGDLKVQIKPRSRKAYPVAAASWTEFRIKEVMEDSE